MTGRVYFVSAPGRVKIGWTAQPEQRLKSLQALDMERLTTLAIVEGSRRLERKLQLLADPYHLRGEWFHDCAEVRELMAMAISGKIIAEEKESEDFDLTDHAEYFELKRLPVLQARADATRLYREFLEEIYETILRRKEDGRSIDDLLAVMRKLEPRDAVTEGFGEQSQRKNKAVSGPFVGVDP